MRKKLKPFLKIFAALAVITFILLTVIAIGTYIYYANTLTSEERIMNNNNTGVVLLDRNGTPFFSFYEGKGKKIVPLKDISPHLVQAILSMEDNDFYIHNGVSLKGIIRSVVLNTEGGKISYGGSTITQQLVKNSLLSPRRSFLRKYQEAILAYEIEKRYSKNEILEMYLNSVYFGEGAFGAENAAETYFGKNAKDLTLSESALLAGLLPAPSELSPISGDRQASFKKQQLVLNRMKELGKINEQTYKEAKSAKIVINKSTEGLNSTAEHFALKIKDILVREFGEENIARAGLQITTTLDLPLQKYAQQSVAENVERLKPHNVTNASAVVMSVKNREVLALVGSVSWDNSDFGKINMAFTPRQPGSSFKPIVYATAFDDRVLTPGTVLKDVPTTFKEPNSPDYKPKDYDRKYRGNVLPRRALANSLNIPAVEVMSKLSVPEVLDKTQQLGITTLKDPNNYGLSLVLGAGEVPPVEMTNVYATFADGGEYKQVSLIKEIKDKHGKDVTLINGEPRRVFSQQAAYLITSILSDVKARAEVFGSTLNVPFPAAVKTGTTEDYKDAWTLGYTPDVAVGVWVGNSNNKPMDNVAGSLGAAPIWKDLISRYQQGRLVKNFQKPSGIAQVSICTYNGLRAKTATSSANLEYFIEGTEPSGFCNIAKIPDVNSSASAQVFNPTGTPSANFNEVNKQVAAQMDELKKQARKSQESLRKRLQH